VAGEGLPQLAPNAEELNSAPPAAFAVSSPIPSGQGARRQRRAYSESEETSSGTSYSTHRDGTIEGVGLTVGEGQAVTRRQLVASVVVAILVITVGVVALRYQLVRGRVTADFSILYLNSSTMS
jgi:hypothetical protein